MKKLYCFDFDGTLTFRDTMFLFLKFYNPSKFRWNFVKYTPLFILLKLKLAKPEKIKENFIASILKGEKEEILAGKAQEFFNENYLKFIRPNALDFIQNINYSKCEALLVTASLDVWTKPFAEKFGMELIATKAAYENGIFTGKFASPNCNGAEKLNRIKQWLGDKKFDKTIAFGDTSGDLQMLEWADEGHFAFFH